MREDLARVNLGILRDYRLLTREVAYLGLDNHTILSRPILLVQLGRT